MIGQLPPYALATPNFRFRALASHAGRAPLGGDREIVLACFAAARLAAGMLPPLSIAPPEGAARAAAAKIWLASQSLPQQTRASVTSVIDAVSDTKLKAAAGGVRSLLDGARAHLDPASIQELETLASELSQPPG